MSLFRHLCRTIRTHRIAPTVARSFGSIPEVEAVYTDQHGDVLEVSVLGNHKDGVLVDLERIYTLRNISYKMCDL